VAAFIGSTVEYYDFLLYTVAAALVFPQVFFPDLAPGVGTIASFGTLAAGYFARPLGAIVCGHFGDRIGRKALLVFTLLLMGVGSILIGLLPTYGSIGITAPVLLVVLRVMQGFATGGEWGGSVLIAVEAAPERRGFFGGFTQAGGAAGSVLATTFMTVMSRVSGDEFLTWGWRVPFLASAVLVAIGLLVRLQLEESAEFAQARKRDATVASPLRAVLVTHHRSVLVAVLLVIGGLALQGMMATYMLAYATGIGYDKSVTLDVKIIMTIGNLAGVLFFAWASDRIGKRRSVVIGSVLLAATAFPLFAVVNTVDGLAYGLAMTAMYTIVHPLMFAPLAGLLSEMFPVTVRYTGAALSYQLGSVLGAGLAPLIASSLLASAGGGTNTHTISLFLVVVAVITILGTWLSRGLSAPSVATEPRTTITAK